MCVLLLKDQNLDIKRYVLGSNLPNAVTVKAFHQLPTPSEWQFIEDRNYTSMVNVEILLSNSVSLGFTQEFTHVMHLEKNLTNSHNHTVESPYWEYLYLQFSEILHTAEKLQFKVC